MMSISLPGVQTKSSGFYLLTWPSIKKVKKLLKVLTLDILRLSSTIEQAGAKRCEFLNLGLDLGCKLSSWLQDDGFNFA